ncbi:hypothetical protein G6F43_008581 [Rhizopus delemar]|nr:hypothetical protein G6F43_008581 [Rhizopus delemar]
MIHYLEELEFLINKEKSILIPNKVQSLLGFQFDTRRMTIQVPKEKIQKLETMIRQLLKTTRSRLCSRIASLIGKITAMIPAVGEALLHVRSMKRDLARALRNSNHNWELACSLSTTSRQELTWWINKAPLKKGLPIRYKQPSPYITIYVDASDSGWGVSSQSVQTAGYWTKNEKEESINCYVLVK